MRKLLASQRQFFVYLIGGCVSALIDVGIMQLFIVQGINYVMAASAGFVVGLLINYAFHANLTFRASITTLGIVRYLCVVGINYFLTIAFVSLSVSLVGIALIGKLVSLPIIAINGYLFGKHWIFK